MSTEELEQYSKLLGGLVARLFVDDSKEDHRRSPRILNAKYLAATDARRALESLQAYRELMAEPSPGERSSNGAAQSG